MATRGEMAHRKEKKKKIPATIANGNLCISFAATHFVELPWHFLTNVMKHNEIYVIYKSNTNLRI
jgi:predicted transcriptional regulator